MPMMTRLHRPRLAEMRKTVRPHLPRLTGAWCWRRKVNRQQHKNARKDLPDVLATYLQLFEAAGRRARGGGRSHPGFLCAVTGAPGSGLRSQGERAPAFLSARVTNTFHNRPTALRDGDQARQATRSDSIGRVARERAS